MTTTSIVVPTGPKAQDEFDVSDRNTGDMSALAAATFEAFQPYINVRDCGKKLWDDKEGKLVPKHLITQEAFKLAEVWESLPKERRKIYKPVFKARTRSFSPTMASRVAAGFSTVRSVLLSCDIASG